MSDDFTIETIDAQKLSRIKTIINHRTDYGTFEDEESQLFEYLIEDRERLKRELKMARQAIKNLTDQLIAGSRP
jgi:hypothetical protein